MPVLPRADVRSAHRQLPRIRAAAVALLAGTILAATVVPGALAADPPNPVVNVGLGSQALIGSDVSIDVAFDNASATQTGYGPYVDLRLPLGADGDDGLTFTGATYLGAAVASTKLTADAGGCVTHPYAVTATGAALVVCGLAPGQSFVVLRLPFGSFTPDQPPIHVTVTASMSNLADAGTPLAVTGSGGFQFGATAVADPATDPSITGSPDTASVTPTVLTLTKVYDGPESETATGPGFPRHYTVAAEVAPGQVVTNLRLADALPSSIQFDAFDGSTPGSTAVATPDTTVPGGALARLFASVTGGAGADASFRFGFHVPLVDAGGSDVVDPVTGSAVTSVDNATATGSWTPLDPRDAPTVVTAGPVTHRLTDRSVAIQKSVVIAPGGDVAPLGIVNPGDTLQWTMAIQVSDFFAFSDVHIHDRLADGTRADPGYVPTLAVAGNGYALAAAPFDPTNISVGPVDGSGITPAVLDISSELVTRGRSARLVGGCVDPAGGSATPDCNVFDDGPTTAVVTFRSIVQATHVDGAPVVEGDALDNETSVTGAVLDTATLAPTGAIAGDGSVAVAIPGSSASVEIPRGSLAKSIYAINGSTAFASPPHFSPGDTITFRIVQTFPTSRFDDFRIEDYMPLPVLAATEVTTLDPTASAAAPPAGTVKYGPSDTFHGLPGAPTPAISTDAGANRLTLTYGDYATAAPGVASKADILVSVTVSNDPFADGLLLTNQARSLSKNNGGTEATVDSIVQFVLDQPALGVTKGAVASSRADAVFTPAVTGPRAFAIPASAACPAWTGGAITSAGLTSTPIDSDVSGLDAGDIVRFAITLENTGHADAFDARVKDDLPSGFGVPAGGLHLCANRGDAATLDVTAIGGGTGLLDQGILVTGTGGTPAALAGSDASGTATADGSNVIVVSFELEVLASARPAAILVNTATLDAYANATGGANHLGAPLTDQATASLRTITVAKDVIASDQAHTTSPAVAIGEVVTYRVVVTVPEGTTGPATLTDALPAGLAFVGCDGITVSSGALVTSLPGGFPDACDPPLNPTVLPATGAGGGRTAAFNLGTITNTDRDNTTLETLTLEYRASVINAAANVRGTTLVNAATVAWNDGVANRSVTDAADAIRVVEPRLALNKTVNPTSGDAGDTLTYQIVVTNPVAAPNGATAFEASLADMIPAGLTYVPSSLQRTAGTAPTTLGEASGVISATWTTFASGGTTTLQYQATVDAGVTPGQVITNTASAAWSSLPGTVAAQSPYNDVSAERTGSTGDPGGAANTYTATDPATFTVAALAPVKSIVATSEASTAGSSVVVGEIVRYRLEVAIPEGSTPVLTLTDRLPNGLSYLEGTAKVALVSTGGGLTSDTLTDPDVAKTGDQTTLSSITPTYTLPGSAVSGGVGDGADPVFALGSLVNTENDASVEYAVVEFNALVDNVAGNTAGTNRDNDFQVRTAGNLAGTSNATRVTVRHPVLAVDKVLSIVPTDGGDALRYTITLTNAGSATAFETDLADTLDARLVMSSVSTATSGTVSGVVDLSDAATNSVHVTVATIAVGGSVTITVNATVTATIDAGSSIPNTATGTWTSLPGSGTSPNPTGSVTPGTAGSGTGERTGSGGVNSYTDPGTVAAQLASPSIAKLPISPTAYPIGATPAFTLRVTVPEGTTRHLVVTDTIPAGLIVTGQTAVTAAASSGGNLAADFAGTLPAFSVTAAPAGAAGGALSLDFGDVANPADGDTANDSFLVLVSTRVANVLGNQAGTALVNRASLDFTDPESGTTTVNAPATRTVTVVEPVLTVDKTASPSNALFGGVVTYTLVVANAGPASTADAFDIDLSDTLPAGLTYVPGSLAHTAGTAPATLAESGGTITAAWTSFPLAGSSTLSYQATVGAPGAVDVGDSLVNGVATTWTSLAGSQTGERTGVDGPGGGLDNYAATDTAPVTVGGIDLGITKTDGAVTASAGATLTYALGVTNAGNLSATAVVITETVPAHTTFRTAGSSSGWSCANGAPAGSSCNLTIPSIAAGTTAGRTFVVGVDAPLPPGVSSVANTATVADDGSHGPDPDLTDNTATDTDIVPVADLSLTKLVDDPAPNVGDVVTFTVTATNAGPDTAPGVAVNDPLPAGLDFVSSSASRGTYSDSTGTWTIGAMAPGDTVTLSIDARVTTSGTKTNAAEVSASGASDPDSTPGNGDPGEDDRATASLTPRLADLAVVKTVDNARANVGEQVTFTVTLRNLGPDTATNVVVDDPLPAGLSFVGATASQGNYDDTTGHWTVGTVAVGAIETLALTATVDTLGEITNTASVGASDVLDPNPANNTDTARIDQLVDLVVGKSVDHPAQDVGRDVVFTVTVRNDGPSAATGVVLHDALPAGLDHVSHTGDGTYVPGTGAWTVGSLANGATATLHITATVTAPAPVTNTASVVTVDQPQSRTDNDEDRATVTPPSADVALTKVVSDARPALGEQTTWTVTVANNGPDAAADVVVTDILPAGLSFVSASASQGSYDAGTGAWTVGAMAAGATQTLDLLTEITALGDRTNTATASATTYDPDLGNNTDDAFLTTKLADIGVGKHVDDPTPAVGQVVTFAVTATNNGPDPARKVVLRDRLPAGVAYVSDDGAGAYDPGTGDWAIGNMAVDDTATLHVDARVIASGTTTNTVSLHSLVEEDTNPDNNEAAASLDAPPAADLRLAKRADPPTVANGQDTVFTLTVTNDGPDATTGVVVADRLPAGLAYVSDDGGGTYDPATGDWAVGDLGVGDSARLRITATVTQPGEIVNAAEVTASGLPDPDSTPGNGNPGEDDSAQVVLNADNRADLSLTKTASPTKVEIGGQVTYTLTLRNAGPDTATGVVVRDQLPAGVSYVRHRGGTYDPDTGAWTVGTIGVGEARTLKITVRVGKLGTQVNRAEVATSDAFDPDSTPGNGAGNEDDLGVAAIGGLRPSMPPTYAAGPPVSGTPEQLDPRGLAGILVAVALLALAIRPRRRAHGR
jgi:large repetitive protein